MTCVLAVPTGDGKVCMGADSAGVRWLDLTIRADEKVFVNPPFIMGFTSSFRMGQLLRHAFSPPYHQHDVSVEKYMCTTFVDAVRACLKAGGFAKKDDDVETGGTFIVGYRGRVCVVEGDYQVAIPADGYAAVGCGDQIAHGVLWATRGRSAQERVRLALEAAEHFSAGVRSPFHIIEGGGT